MRRFATFAPCILPVFFLLVLSSKAAAGKVGCIACHSGPRAHELGLKDIYAEIESEESIHDSILEKCDVCHTINAPRLGRTWQMDSYYSARSLIFFLKGLSLDRTYDLDLKVKDVYGKEYSFPVASFEPHTAGVAENDGIAPLVKDLRVEGVEAGIFLSAVIKWETDKPTITIVEYGNTPGYGEKMRLESLFKTEHTVKLSGLKAGLAYHARIISKDVFGNTAASGDFLIDTAAEFKKTNGRQDIKEKGPSSPHLRLFRIDSTGDTCVQITASFPVKAGLTVSESIEIGKHASGLSPARDARINACKMCHPQSLAHPVGIMSTNPRIKIPPELPTIEGGVITCVTCHRPHGGGEAYFARFPFERELCEKCHKEGI